MPNGIAKWTRSILSETNYRLRRGVWFLHSKLTGSRRRFPSRRIAQPETMRRFFNAIYERPELAAWEIAAPQPAFVSLGAAGEIRGDVLDVGCGSGEQAMYAQTLGCCALGVDFAESAIALAQRRAKERGSSAEFIVGDVRELETLGRTFDTALDAGTFHALDDNSRACYAASLRNVLRPGGALLLLCLCEFEGNSPGARLVTQQEIREVFSETAGWRIEWIRETVDHLNDRPTRRYSGCTVAGHATAWLAKIVRQS